MRSGRTKIATFLLCFSLACAVPQLLADKKDQAGSGADDQRRALHALSRLTFGPRPGDVQQVMAMGVERWIAWQLHPEKIDDSALNARLEPLRTLRLSAREIAEDFPDGQEINQVRNGKKPMPSDAARRAVFQVQMARQEEKKERKEVAAKNAAADTVPEKTNGAPRDGSMMPENASRDAMNDAVKSGTNSAASTNPPTDGKSIPHDPDTMAAAAPAPPTKVTREEEEQERQREARLHEDLEIQHLPLLPPDERFKKVLAM